MRDCCPPEVHAKLRVIFVALPRATTRFSNLEVILLRVKLPGHVPGPECATGRHDKQLMAAKLVVVVLDLKARFALSNRYTVTARAGHTIISLFLPSGSWE